MDANNEKKKVAILFGGKSDEYEVSLESTASLLENIDTTLYEVFPIGITKQNEFFLTIPNSALIKEDGWQECTNRPIYFHSEYQRRGFYYLDTHEFQAIDVAIPMIHGALGEDGTLVSLLKLCKIPYCSCPPHSLMIGFDKELSHQMAKSLGIPVPKSISLYKHYSKEKQTELLQSLSYPLYVKPARSGSSIGISHVHTKKELQSAINLAFQYDDKILVEEEIKGIEAGVAILGNDSLHISTPDIIDTHHQFFDYTTKYVTHSQDNYTQSYLPQEINKQIKYYAEILYRAMECQVMARIDFFVDEEYHIYFNEINSIPGLPKILDIPK